jgi:DNA ligase-1
MATFPPLQKEAKMGKINLWSIEVKAVADGGQIVCRRGYEDGVVQVEKKIVSEGKNIGRKNETTALQQAIQDARTAWNKKVAEGYAEVDDGEEDEDEEMVHGGAGHGGAGHGGAGHGGAGRESKKVAAASKSLEGSKAAAVDIEVPMPMLANKLAEKEKHVVFPWFAQPKFDGTRSVGICGEGEGHCLFSRQRKAYPHLDHIQAVLRKLPEGLVLDGELYTTKHKFQKIVGLVKQKTIKKDDLDKHNDIQLHVYDIVDAEKTFTERFAVLQKLFKDYTSVIGTVLQLCPTVLIRKKEELKPKHDEYVAAGYEGLMLRNPKGLYAVGQRSSDLLKMKDFFDDEFEVVDFYEGEGREKGCVMWKCKTKAGQEFGCRPEGTHEERAELFKEGGAYVGKMLTIRYQELTKDGLPRFPVGVAFRDYE